MAVKMCSTKRPYFIWKTPQPYVDESRESPFFSLNGRDCCFRMCAHKKEGKEIWKMYMHVSRNYSKLLVSTYVEDKDKKLHLMRLSSTIGGKPIWSDFGHKMQGRRWKFIVNGVLTFIFMFDTIIESISDFEEEIQTAPRNIFSASRFLRTGSQKTDSLGWTTQFQDTSCLNNLSADLQKLVEEGSLSDMELKCEDRTLPVHRIILSARSEVFAAMMRSDMVESRSGSIEITDVEFPILQQFVNYLYTGTLPEMTMEGALQLYVVADKYAVRALKRRCSDFLIQSLTLENALKMLIWSDVYSDEDFKKLIVSYVTEEVIPKQPLKWNKFCNEHSVLAMKVLNYSADVFLSKNEHMNVKK